MRKTIKTVQHFLVMGCIYTMYISVATAQNDSTFSDSEKIYDPGADTNISPPVFPGCITGSNAQLTKCFQEKIIAFIGQNFRYPADAKEMNYQGTIIVQFVVEKDGSPGNASVLKETYESLDKEALRVIQGLPQMQPAILDGKNVRVRYVIPIVCRIDDGKPAKKSKKKKPNKKDIPHWK